MTNNQRSNLFWLMILIGLGFLWFAFRMMDGEILIPALSDIFTFVLFAPVAEELFFRGVIQDAIDMRIKNSYFGISYANILTSLMFAAFHIPFWGFPQGVLVFFPSVAFGFIYDKTGKISYPIILHAVYNLNIFIV